jgi:hypothetical protein
MSALPWIVLFTLLFGALLVALPYVNRATPAFHPKSFMGRAEAKIASLRHWLHVHFRYVDLGGYVHDTAMSQWIPPAMCSYITGTWTDTVGAVTGTVTKTKTAADNTGVVYIPIAPPQNSVAQKGSYLKSIDVWWNTTTAALDAAGLIANVDRFVLPANGAAFPALTAIPFTYSDDQNTPGETDDLDEHKLTITIDTPFWMDDDYLVQVRLTADAAATSVFAFHGARVNYTLRL